ncbi:hypothetical protein [Dehalobacter restrictus]|uniref:hypothetical protein n=1 Tax=Dehalobacter restrictus TaxID=55583 RepID=UPI00338D7402
MRKAFIERPRMETVSFRVNLAAGEEVTLTERIKSDGTIESMRARFYAGQENCLQIRPCVLQKGRKSLIDLLTYPEGTVNYISGEDDTFEYPVVLSVQNDDEIKLYCKNVGDYEYTIVIDIVIDYFAGENRVIGGVL